MRFDMLGSRPAPVGRPSAFSMAAAIIATMLAITPRPSAAACSDPYSLFSSPLFYNSPSAASVVLGDFDRDGILDLATSGHGNSIQVLLGNGTGGVGDGTFRTGATLSVGPEPFGLATGDFNGDGKLDLVTSNVGSNSISLLLGNGDGTFAAPTSFPTGVNPISVTAVDLNGDGLLDLVTGDLGGTVSVLLGRPAATFAPAVQYSAGPGAAYPAVADLNGDGILDLAVPCAYNNTVAILLGNGSGGVGNGTFGAAASYPVGAWPHVIAARDLNSDGIPDLVVATSNQTTITLLFGQGSGGVGNGTFGPPVTYEVGSGPRGIGIADFDGDGLLDLVVTSQYGAHVAFLRGHGIGTANDGTFAPAINFSTAGHPSGLVLADFNHDGHPDLAIAGFDYVLSVLRYSCTSLPPSITSFAPTSGGIGDAVSVTGSNFGQITGVKFNGTPASFGPFTNTSVQCVVPAGATTGRISVTNPTGTGQSATDFIIVSRPVITSASPMSGKIGTVVTIAGSGFTPVTSVRFGAGGNALVSVDSDVQITAMVDPAATTGPIAAAAPGSTGTSSFDFTVIPPDPRPMLVSVRDVPNDQGGRVVLKWHRSDLDASYARTITGYRIWRRAPATSSARAVAAAGSVSGRGPESAAPTSTRFSLSGFWEAIGTQPAVFLDGYAFVAPTTQDSLPDSNPYTAFFVEALTADPYVFYDSPVDSGYSVDNLAPAQPRPFAAVFLPAEVALHWGMSSEADLFGYRIYRGASANFVPGPANLLVATPDTGFVDRDPGSLSHYYKLSAVDVHGNESHFALVSPDGATATLVSVVRVRAEPNRVTLEWLSVGNPGISATVYRRDASSDWATRAVIQADASGRLSYEDTEVEPGTSYAYRVGIQDGASEAFSIESWADVPRFEFALEPVRPNPSVDGELNLEFTLAEGGRTRVDLIDVFGRQVESIALNPGGPGRQVVALGRSRRLAPGIYMIRVTQGHRSAVGRAAVLR